uniref:Putative thyropin n=1 Tax=Amblyomma cajennense TaxID=34607 RepID=A0A023FUD9_AMBCJ
MARVAPCVLVIFALIGYIHCAHTGETDCQRRRRTEQHATRNLTGLLVPECDEHGEYKAIQCFGEAVRGRPFCACYDREFGQIKGPSRSLRSCNCIRAHHEWERSRDSSRRESEPRCDTTSGEFNPVQCSRDEHWCVDRDTGAQLSEKQRGGCSTDLSQASCGIGDTHHGHGAGHGDSTHRTGSHHDDTSHHDTGSRHGDSTRHSDSSHHGDDSSHRGSSSSRSGSGSRSTSGSRSGSDSHSDSGSHSGSGSQRGSDSHSGSSTSHQSGSGH